MTRLAWISLPALAVYSAQIAGSSAQQPPQSGVLLYPGSGSPGTASAFPTLRAAIAAAPADATITVPPAWSETVTASYVITHSITILAGAGATIRLGASNTAAFTASGVDNVTISGLTFDGQRKEHAWTGCLAIQARGIKRLEISHAQFRNFGLCRGVYAAQSTVFIHDSRFSDFGNGQVLVNGGAEGILIRDPVASSTLSNLEFDTFSSDNPIHIFGDTSAGMGNVSLSGIHTSNTWRNSVEIQGVLLGRIEVTHSILENLRSANYFCLTGSTMNKAGALPESLDLGVLIDGVVCRQGPYVRNGIGIEFFSDYGTIANSQVTGFADSISFGGHDFRITDNTFIAPNSACIVENYTYRVDHALIDGNTCVNPRANGIVLGSGGSPGDAAGDRVTDNHISRTPGFWPDDSANPDYCSIALAKATSPVRIVGNELVLSAAPVPGSFAWKGGICHSLNTPGNTYSGNTFLNETTSPFGTAFWESGPAFEQEEIDTNRYINLASIGNYPATAHIGYHGNRSLAITALPWDDTRVYPAGELVTAGGAVFAAAARNTKQAPPDPMYWSPVKSSPATDWTVTPVSFKNLGGALNGTSNYCSDCKVSGGSVSGGGTGAWVVLVNGTWTGLGTGGASDR